MESSKSNFDVSSTAIALACVVGAGITYAFIKLKYRLRDAGEAFNHIKIKTVLDTKTCDDVVKDLRRRSKFHRAIGFDCEWVTKAGKRQPVALVQLSSFDGLCGLFRLSHMECIPETLKALLEDESIYKVGVAPSDDAKYLCQDYSVILRSTLDIRHLAELCGHKPGGLAALSKSLLHVLLDKSWRVRCGDWSADELSQRQVRYAAADAYVAVKIFVNLINEYARSKGPLPWFNRSPLDDVWRDLDDLCWKYADVCFATKQKSNAKTELWSKERKTKESTVGSKRYPNATRTRPLYHNCFLEAPDGEMLCTCDNKKALWYVEKGLADVVCDSPLRVRLRFEPAGRAVGDVGRYYRLTKENKCVVCGGADSYIRKNVVPREYRKYFPEIMKDHSSHDVVLLCVRCHQASNARDQAVRERLAAQCAAPLASRGEPSKYSEDVECKKIRSAARALLSKKHVLPDARRMELEDVLLRHYTQHKEITPELLQQAAEIQVVFENAEYESHGLKVVECYLQREGGLLRLEELWREHFLSSMRPRYMPELWSIKHNQERLQIKLNEGRLTEPDLKSVGPVRWIKL